MKSLKSVFGAFAFTMVLSAQVQAQSFLTNGLVAYYPFNGNANEATGQGSNGVVVNAVLTTDRFGNANQAYAFDGATTWIQTTNYWPVLGSNAVTVSCWMDYEGGIPQPLAESVMLSWGGDITPGSRFQFSLHNGGGFTTTIMDSGGNEAVANTIIPTGKWCQVAVVLPANGEPIDAAYYLNGAQVPTFPGADTSYIFNFVPTVPLAIGHGSLSELQASGRVFDGKLDDIRIYNRALSSNEVAELYAIESTPPPHTATGTAVLTGSFVTSAGIVNGGYGYTNTPQVRFIGGGGSGAQAVAVVSNGVVTAINVFDAGFGYTNAPLIVIEPPFIPNPILGIAPMSFLAFSNLTTGGAYQLQQAVAWYWSNQPVSFTATNALYTQMVAGVAGSGDYRLALNPVPTQAFATPQVVNGFVVGATVTSGGSGYVTSPTVSIVGGGGSNATAVSQISGGVVTNITLTDAGIGYTNTPTVEIAQPPAATVSPTVLPVMRLDSANLAPYDNYQIQFKPDLGTAWGNWDGGSFSPTDVTNSQYVFITNDVGFFRLQYVP
jgi:Concanavalin A-like lectin/glucanases superfamily